MFFMAEETPALPGRASLSKEQKLGFGLLLIFAFLSVGLGMLQIRNSLYGPLALNNKVSPALKDEINSIDALRLRDTDKDGLSDFEELYVYNTSPYLYDTFSYGMSDKEVVAKGLALCPKGQDCSSPIASGGSAITTNSSTVVTTVPNPGAPPADVFKLLSDPSQVRQLLISNGTDPKLLNKVSDDQLMGVVNDVLKSTTTQAAVQSLGGLSSLKLPGAQ